MPAVLEVERIRHSISIDRVMGGEKWVSASFILSSNTFSNHASGSGARVHDLFSSRLRPCRFSGAGSGDWWLLRLPTLGGDASGMHASGQGGKHPGYILFS